MRAISNMNSLPEPVFATNRILGNIGAPLDVDRHPSDSIFGEHTDDMNLRSQVDDGEEHEMGGRDIGRSSMAS